MQEFSLKFYGLNTSLTAKFVRTLGKRTMICNGYISVGPFLPHVLFEVHYATNLYEAKLKHVILVQLKIIRKQMDRFGNQGMPFPMHRNTDGFLIIFLVLEDYFISTNIYP